MSKGKIFVAGIGPGSASDITPAVLNAVGMSDVVIGYKPYFRYVAHALSADAVCVDSGMRQEVDRCAQALQYAVEGKTVCVISSGDAGIYGMAPLVMEMAAQRGAEVEVEVLPGISAFQKAASLLGAPVGHDFCVVSLSDHLTPWSIIERRIEAAAMADFVTAVYNPKSRERYWQLYRLKEIFTEHRDGATLVGCVRNAGRDDERVWVTTLAEFDPEMVDMFTVVIIGNSQTFAVGEGRMVTPRGYSSKYMTGESVKVGQAIMIDSFRSIESKLEREVTDKGRKWALLHAIHTTADFEMERLLWMDEGAVDEIHSKIVSGAVKTIVTDVTMAASGIRKGALERLGIEVKCYINDPRAMEMARSLNITRAQAGMRLAADECSDALFVFGNAPTALLELCSLVRRGKIFPSGIIAAPVGFVHVRESKYAAKTLRDIPKIIVDGNKGGSNLAATLVNSVLTFDDAEDMKPGRDV